MRALRLNPKRLSSVLCVGLIFAALALSSAAVSRPLVLALAERNRIFMGIGRYDPKRGWLGPEGLDRPAEPGEYYTIYTMAGQRAVVKNTDPYQSPDWQAPAEWTARITPWTPDPKEPYGLAVQGQSPVPAPAAEVIDLAKPDIVSEIANYLKTKGLEVPQPTINQAFRVEFSADKPQVYLVAAHSANEDVRDQDPHAYYQMALMLESVGSNWKITPLLERTSFKPKTQSVSDHEHYYGPPEFYRFVACLDVNQDGTKDIFIRVSKEDGTEIDVFSMQRQRMKQVISIFRHHFND